MGVGDGSDIILWSCGRTDEFLWTVSGDHILLETDPHYCLTIREGRPENGADIILWSCDDSDAGRWVISDGRIRWKAHMNYCMTAREGRAGDGTNLILWSCDVPYDSGGDEL